MHESDSEEDERQKSWAWHLNKVLPDTREKKETTVVKNPTKPVEISNRVPHLLGRKEHSAPRYHPAPSNSDHHCDELVSHESSRRNDDSIDQSCIKHTDIQDLNLKLKESIIENTALRNLLNFTIPPNKIGGFRDSLLFIVASCVTARSSLEEALNIFLDSVPLTEFETIRYRKFGSAGALKF